MNPIREAVRTGLWKLAWDQFRFQMKTRSDVVHGVVDHVNTRVEYDMISNELREVAWREVA